ncbi:MAG: hypothetical protein HY279_10210 [Nitrospinae bacterium]|nr:hypothetical protein [Nitrospinota bacterium]
MPNWSLGTRAKGSGRLGRGHEKQSVGRSRQSVLMSRFHSKERDIGNKSRGVVIKTQGNEQKITPVYHCRLIQEHQW